MLLWNEDNNISKEKAAEQFVAAARLNQQNGAVFRYLGHYYSRFSEDPPRALKCYQRALSLDPTDSDCGVGIFIHLYIYSIYYLFIEEEE